MGSSSALLFSVITPHNGTDRLRHFLQALTLQTLPPDAYEVLIVTQDEKGTDACTLHFRDYLSIRTVPFKSPDNFLGHPAGLMRNLGATQARASRLVFLDSDCLLAPGGLEMHAASDFKDPSVVVISGAVPELPATEVGSLPPFFYGSFEWMERRAHTDFRVRHSKSEQRRRSRWDELYAGNFSAPAELFLSCGGFDESGHRCHDMELGYRLYLEGAELWFFPDCKAIHLEHPRSLSFRDGQASGWAHIAEKYPELAAEAHDRLLAIRDLKHAATARCERRIDLLASRLPGVRAGKTFVLPPNFSEQRLLEALDGIAYVRSDAETASRFALRLDRDSWDYEIVLPTIGVPSRPKITVAVPLYNSAQTVTRAIDSVFSQTFQDFEIIAVDDASTDDTLPRLTKYFVDGRLRVLTSPRNRGLAHALNRALLASRGGILVQLDSDDWLESEALHEIVKAFLDSPGAGALYGAPFIHQDGLTIKETGRAVSSPAEVLSYRGVQAPRAYKVETLRRLGGWDVSDAFEGRYFEDRNTLAKVARDAPLIFCPKLLYHVQVREDSLARTEPKKAATAKVAIVWSQAQDLDLMAEVVPAGNFAEARFSPRINSAPPNTWSVIIPAQGRASLLGHTLRSWLESDLAQREGEIIVVDDHSEEPLEHLRGLDTRIRLISLDSVSGPAAARNLGAKHAKGEMLFFCDSDMVIPPDVLSSHERRHHDRGRPALVVGCAFGRRAFSEVSRGIPPERLLRLVERCYFNEPALLNILEAILVGRRRSLVGSGAGVWRQLLPFSFTESWCKSWGELMLYFGDDLAGYPHRWMRVGTGNLSVSAALFRELGGFDEELTSMEDWDLGLRAQRGDIPILTAPEAEPLHQIHSVDPRRKSSNLEAVGRLKEKYPDEVRRLVRSFSHLRPPGAFEIIDCLERLEFGAANQTRAGNGYAADAASLPPYALTFDDGPHPVVTPALLEELNKAKVAATFFILAANVRRSARLCREIIESGHEIALHGWDHEDMSCKYSSELRSSLEKSIKAIEDTVGVSPLHCRPAYGRASPAYSVVTSELGLRVVGWHVHSRDWAAITWQEILADLILGGVPGKVLLLHDGTSDFEQIVPAVKHLAQMTSRHGIRGLTVTDYAKRASLPALDV